MSADVYVIVRIPSYEIDGTASELLLLLTQETTAALDVGGMRFTVEPVQVSIGFPS